jgi:hypothetical protein
LQVAGSVATVAALTAGAVVYSSDRIASDDATSLLAVPAEAGIQSTELAADAAELVDQRSDAGRVAHVKSAALTDQATAAAAKAAADAAAQAAVDAAAAETARRAEEAARQAQTERAARDAQRQSLIENAKKDPRAAARVLLGDFGFADSQFSCLDSLWTRESNWLYNTTNRSSGAYGIPQSLPASKMASVGADYRINPVTQIKWGLGYIQERYGTPCGAWAHSQATGWY